MVMSYCGECDQNRIHFRAATFIPNFSPCRADKTCSIRVFLDSSTFGGGEEEGEGRGRWREKDKSGGDGREGEGK